MNDERFDREQFGGADGSLSNEYQDLTRIPPNAADGPYQAAASGYGGASDDDDDVPSSYDEAWALQEAQLFSRQSAETDKMIEQQFQRDRKLLSELDAVLEKGSSYRSSSEVGTAPRKISRRTRRFAKKGVGLISLGLILIFMGIVMITTLSAPIPDHTRPLKLSPICAMMIGAEIIIGETVTRGRCRLNIPCLLISVAFVAGCCILTANLGGGDYQEETALYNNRTVAGEIYDRSYKELKGLVDIVSLSADVNLNPDGQGSYNGVDALSAGDIVNINAELGGVYYEPAEFAADCKKIIDAYKKMKINITNFHFSNESRLRSYTLDVEGKYAQDHDAERLKDSVNYVYIEDYDYIEDLEDYSEPSNSNN